MTSASSNARASAPASTARASSSCNAASTPGPPPPRSTPTKRPATTPRPPRTWKERAREELADCSLAAATAPAPAIPAASAPAPDHPLPAPPATRSHPLGPVLSARPSPAEPPALRRLGRTAFLAARDALRHPGDEFQRQQSRGPHSEPTPHPRPRRRPRPRQPARHELRQGPAAAPVHARRASLDDTASDRRASKLNQRQPERALRTAFGDALAHFPDRPELSVSLGRELASPPQQRPRSPGLFRQSKPGPLDDLQLNFDLAILHFAWGAPGLAATCMQRAWRVGRGTRPRPRKLRRARVPHRLPRPPAQRRRHPARELWRGLCARDREPAAPLAPLLCAPRTSSIIAAESSTGACSTP